MVNIMLEGYDFDAPWLRGELAGYILPGSRVAIIAFSFRDSRVKCAADWDLLYASGGLYRDGMVKPFTAYGISEQDIEFIDYFRDTPASARQKVADADILFFPGGLPDRMMDRIEEFGLADAIRAHKGVVMGYSAGAVIQLGEYHLSPDDDYPEFGYFSGLGLVSGFYVEVHYEALPVQDAAIKRVLAQRGGPVFATKDGAGALVTAGGKTKALGSVSIFR